MEKILHINPKHSQLLLEHSFLKSHRCVLVVIRDNEFILRKSNNLKLLLIQYFSYFKEEKCELFVEWSYLFNMNMQFQKIKETYPDLKVNLVIYSKDDSFSKFEMHIISMMLKSSLFTGLWINHDFLFTDQLAWLFSSMRENSPIKNLLLKYNTGWVLTHVKQALLYLSQSINLKSLEVYSISPPQRPTLKKRDDGTFEVIPDEKLPEITKREEEWCVTCLIESKMLNRLIEVSVDDENVIFEELEKTLKFVRENKNDVKYERNLIFRTAVELDSLIKHANIKFESLSIKE